MNTSLPAGDAATSVAPEACHRPTLLVVDDEPVNIQVLYRALSGHCNVLMATGGVQALAVARVRRPDLILLDVMMPGMDGYELCRRLKADPGTRDIPVVFVTAHDDPQEEARGLDLGAVDFISKPISPAVVRARVAGHLARRAAEAALVRLNDRLEQRVRERTVELEGARQVADAANQAKSDLLSNMSHEMRTPMNSILGMAYLALKTDPAPKLRDYLKQIDQAGGHLLRLIDDILDFSRADAGKLVVETGCFEFESVIAQVDSQLAQAAQARGLALHFDIDPLLARPMCGDALRLGQVLSNLVGNAIKFSPAGEVAVRVRAVEHDAAGALVCMEVEDSGIGIGPADQARLFQPFQQADASTTRLYGGTGLGLAICQRLATAMGGSVAVRSRLGHGSTFGLTLRLPFADPGQAAPCGAQVTVPGTLQDLGGVTVLVVDDNVFNRQVALELLEGAGACVTLARDGQDALDQLALHPVDCILMDMQMPVMDGLQATRRIRQDPALRSIPVIAMTANANEADAVRCSAAGMDGFIGKPVRPALLRETVALHARRRSTQRPAADDRAPPEVAIDLSVLSRLLAGNPAKLRQFTLLFRTSTCATMDEIDLALAASDLEGLKALGHRAKASSRTVGAARLADLMALLEHAADLAGARALVADIHAHVPLVYAVIDDAMPPVAASLRPHPLVAGVS